MSVYFTVGTNNFSQAKEFYDLLFPIIGWNLFSSYENARGYCLRGIDKSYCLWLVRPFNGEPATPGNGSMIGIQVNSQKRVKEFHKMALMLGGTSEGVPGYRPQYGKRWFGAYIRDLDGNKLCAYCLV